MAPEMQQHEIGDANNSNNNNNNGINGQSPSVRSRHNNNSHSSNDDATTTTSHRRQRIPIPTYSRPGRPKHAALKEFIYGSSLYLACILLPSTPRTLYQCYSITRAWMNMVGERILWGVWVCWRLLSVLVLEKCGWIGGGGVLEEEEEGGNDVDVGGGYGSGGGIGTGRSTRLHFLKKHLFSTSIASLWEEFNEQHRENPPSSSSTTVAPYTWGFGRTASAYPAIAMVLRDIQILTMLAVTLAIIRVWFVHMLVPEYLAPRRLEALTRCKSSHLLSSSSYTFGGVAGWEKAVARAGSSRNGVREGEEEEKHGLYDRLLMWASYHWYR
jgi:hypothetical protein